MKVLHDAGLIHQVEIIKRLLQAEAGARTAKDALQDIDILNLQNLVTLLPKFKIQVVESLPLQDMSPTTIYLVSGGEAYGNLYTEYVWIDDKWEIIGTQSALGLESMTQETASEGTSTEGQSISAKVLNDTIEEKIEEAFQNIGKGRVNITQSDHQMIYLPTGIVSLGRVLYKDFGEGTEGRSSFDYYDMCQLIVQLQANQGYEAGELIISGDYFTIEDDPYYNRKSVIFPFGATINVSATPATSLKETPTVTVTATDYTIGSGNPASTVSVNVSGTNNITPTGTVNIQVVGEHNDPVLNTNETVSLVNGSCSINIYKYDTGTMTVTVQYSGDENYGAATGTTTFTVHSVH